MEGRKGRIYGIGIVIVVREEESECGNDDSSERGDEVIEYGHVDFSGSVSYMVIPPDPILP